MTPGATLAWTSGHDYSPPPAIPEPSTYALMLAGPGILATRGRQRR